MLKYFTQNVLIALFLFAVSAPLILLLMQDSTDISINEKRSLAPLPELFWDQRLLNEFPDLYSDYFDDHFGLRSFIVGFGQRIKQKLFNKSSVALVIRGEQDWLFIDKFDSLRDHVGLMEVNDRTLTNWQQGLITKQNWLKNLGTTYFLLPAPNKMTMYTEFLPKRIRENSRLTMLDQLLEFLPRYGFFDAYAELEPILSNFKIKNPTEPIYYTTDTHWTSLGAYISYQNIMYSLQQYLPQMESPLSVEELRRVPRVKRGDLANIIDLSNNIMESSYTLAPREKCAMNQYIEVPEFKLTDAYKLHKKEIPVFNGCSSKSLTAVVVHDSFGINLRPFFSESFKRVVFISHSYPLAEMASFIRKEKPDVYIDVRVERNLKQLLDIKQRYD